MSYERPSSPYADRILTTHWPQQSEYAWKTFADELTAEFGRLLEQESSQLSIMRQMHDQSSAGLIPAINQLIANRNGTLAARVKAVQIARPIAEAVQSAIISLKADLYWIVETAAQQIKEAEARCAGIGKAAALEGEIQAIIAAAQIEANDADALRSGEAAAHTAKLSEWTPASIRDGDGSGAATPLSTGTVVGGGGAYNAPLSPGNGNGVKAVDYNTMKEGTAADAAHGEAKTAEKPTLSDQARDAAWKPNSLDPKDTATKPNPDKPGMPAQSSPSGGSPASSGGSGGSSVLGSMIRPMTSSPAASPAGRGFSPGGSPAAASPAAAHGGAPGGAPAGAGASSGGGAPGARAASVAGTGSGIAESGARMGAGTVNAAANALGTAGNVGSQVAQGAAAATQSGGPAAAPPAAVSAPVSGAPAGGPPMAMMPPAGGVAAAGPAPVNGSPNVGPGVPGTPPQPGQVAPISLASAAAAGAAGSPVPVAVPMQQMQSVGTPDASGEVLIGQTTAAARSILESMIAQTRKMGYGTNFTWAVSMIYERTGEVTAWLASSEGPSYIPWGVRVPDDVRLAVRDDVVGRQLWDESAAAGGIDPLKLLVQHGQLLDAVAPGTRVLALASSLPIDRVSDWAGEVGARPVSVDARTIDVASANGAGQHRCEVAMPWEWRQANTFSAAQRTQVAERHMLMAANTGHLNDPQCQRVMDAFARNKPISDSDWADVKEARSKAEVDYFLAQNRISAAAADPAPVELAFRTARAAEVVWCLKDHANAEGCADLLYAARLAGAPLEPHEAAT